MSFTIGLGNEVAHDAPLSNFRKKRNSTRKQNWAWGRRLLQRRCDALAPSFATTPNFQSHRTWLGDCTDYPLCFVGSRGKTVHSKDWPDKKPCLTNISMAPPSGKSSSGQNHLGVIDQGSLLHRSFHCTAETELQLAVLSFESIAQSVDLNLCISCFI